MNALKSGQLLAQEDFGSEIVRMYVCSVEEDVQRGRERV